MNNAPETSRAETPEGVDGKDTGDRRHADETPQKLSLEQKLSAYDPVRHGGEVMASAPVGCEAFGPSTTSTDSRSNTN